MKRGWRICAGLAGGLVLALALAPDAGAQDNGAANLYSAIVERNVFGLVPPPPPAPTDVAPPIPPPNVKLTGITTILGNKRALFLVQPSAQPGKPPDKEQSVILTEGEREGSLEVLEINEKADPATVKIKVDGEVSVVTFEKIKLPDAPAAPPPGGNPNIPKNPNFPGGPGAPNMPAPSRSTVLPTRTLPSRRRPPQQQ